MKSKKNTKSIMTLAVLGMTTLFFIHNSLAVSTAKVSVETANLRETADSSSKILEQLSFNQEVEVIEKSGDWYKVKAKEITGYLRQDLITVEEQGENTANTNEEEKVEGEETQNTVESVENTSPIEEKTQTTETTEETQKIVAEDTKLKIVPSINATDIIEIKKDEEVTVIETINDWICVQTKTAKGWVRKEKLKSEEKKEEPEQVVEQNKTQEDNELVEEKLLKKLFVSSQTVNLRKEANTESEVVAKLTLNTSVEVYAEENGWSKVKVNGKEGYISSALLSEQKKEITTSRSSETPRSKTEETTQKQETEKEQTSTASTPSSGKGTTVVATAKNYIGSKYVYGASGPNSFDCSGFTSYVYKLHGVSLSRTAAGQYANGTFVSRNQLQPGDLVMFGPSASSINHVGIYIGGGQIVHAANPSRGVTTDTINSGYYNTNYVGARRVI